MNWLIIFTVNQNNDKYFMPCLASRILKES